MKDIPLQDGKFAVGAVSESDRAVVLREDVSRDPEQFDKEVSIYLIPHADTKGTADFPDGKKVRFAWDVESENTLLGSSSLCP